MLEMQSTDFATDIRWCDTFSGVRGENAPKSKLTLRVIIMTLIVILSELN